MGKWILNYIKNLMAAEITVVKWKWLFTKQKGETRRIGYENQKNNFSKSCFACFWQQLWQVTLLFTVAVWQVWQRTFF